MGSQEYNSQMSKWDEDKRSQQYAAVAITAFAATIAVLVRLYAKRIYKKGWGLDDLFVTIALLILYAEFIASVLSLKTGAGLHQVRVLHEDNSPPYGLQHIYINYWVIAILWAPGVTFIKLSILVLYQRLFIAPQRWVKIAIWTNALYAVMLGIASTVLFIFQCSPVDYYWKRHIVYYGDSLPAGKCLPHAHQYLGIPQILSTASDLAIFFLPVPTIWNLSMQRVRKAAVSTVFLLGAFTIGCGIARIVILFRDTDTEDVTWANIDSATFTVIEAAIGIVCACLPPCAPLYFRLLQRWGLISGISDESELRENYYGSSSTKGNKSAPFLKIPISTTRASAGPRDSFQNLVITETNAHVWSPASENNRGSFYLKETPEGGILVQNRIELSSDQSLPESSKE
ncbi:hypothetical protein N7494_008214 [Penicillium frequentans]|uniref:Rhodopsin domain-containing protein n=1 Tax=Penicillium frequentans TaxID=3151616 RepID=A0AAD6GE70_9EURO|nr:hypothetical protein N7494_008214 [Penicillium glabrum]